MQFGRTKVSNGYVNHRILSVVQGKGKRRGVQRFGGRKLHHVRRISVGGTSFSLSRRSFPSNARILPPFLHSSISQLFLCPTALIKKKCGGQEEYRSADRQQKFGITDSCLINHRKKLKMAGSC